MKFIYLALAMVTIAQLIFFWTGAAQIHTLTLSCWGIYLAIDCIVCYYRRKTFDLIAKEAIKEMDDMPPEDLKLMKKKIAIFNKHLENAKKEMEQEDKNVQ